MKQVIRFIFLSVLSAIYLGAEAPEEGQIKITGAEHANSRKLPPYLVYRHFLTWVNQLDQEATASGTGDAYTFAKPFSEIKLSASGYFAGGRT